MEKKGRIKFFNFIVEVIEKYKEGEYVNTL
jgi:hypothetical protein